MVILCILESTNLEKSIKCTSRWFILDKRMKNLEFDNLTFISYTQPIWVTVRLLFLKSYIVYKPMIA